MERGTVTDAGSARGRALVRMFETVTASHWSGRLTHGHGEVDDLRPLLLLMDIGSCASAEKHTRVNCVTASMGDVAIEHFPRVGELLELRASPVSVGRTSLDVAVLVVAHGCAAAASEGGGDGEEADAADGTAGEHTKRVCEAFFTYVTTKGPNGEKRLAPPLEVENDADSNNDSCTDHREWERTLAQFRKELIRSEQAMAKCRKQHQASLVASANWNKRQSCIKLIPALKHTADTIFESTEVVLPSHQNHMGHLFGGVVMGWMCKSVVAGCILATGLPLSKFRVRSVQRVDFPTGADVSDHICFRPRITAVFEGGRNAEVEVRVSKRKVMPGDEGGAAAERSGRDETLMNVGYFYVSGTQSVGSSTPGELSAEVAPFASLLWARPKTYATDSIYNTSERSEAYSRRKSMIARRHLLAGIGRPIEWDSSIGSQAPLLTIMSVLRLCDEYHKSGSPSSNAGKHVNKSSARVTVVEVIEIGSSGGPLWQSIDFKRTLPNDKINVQVQQVNKCLVRGKTVLRRKKKALATDVGDDAGNCFLEDVFVTIRDKRSQWDPSCVAVDMLESRESVSGVTADGDGKIKTAADNQNKVDWSIVEHRTRDTEGMAGRTFCLLKAASYVGKDDSISASPDRDTEEASAGTARSGAVLASRSISHPKSNATTNWLPPSGWILKTIDEAADGNGERSDHDLLELTYVAEFDFGDFRREIAPKRTSKTEGLEALKDNLRDNLVANVRGLAFLLGQGDKMDSALGAPGILLGQCFRNLASFDHTRGK